MRARRFAALVLLASACPTIPAGRAQGAGDSQELDTSVRAAGMGGATTGVTWGEPGAWGNPAALAGTRGIAWLEGNTRLPVALSPEVQFRSRRFLAGAGGVGLSLMGDPVRDLGRTRLDYREEWGTDPIGNPTGPWEIGERIEGWGVGVSPLQLVDAIRATRSPGSPALTRRADLAAGYQHKRTRVVAAPGIVAEAENHDWGVNGRFTALAGGRDGRSPRLDLSAGYADINADEGSRFDFGGGPGNVAPSTRLRRTGVAARAALPFGIGGEGEPSPWEWWPAGVPSAVVLGVAWDHERRTAGAARPGNSVHHLGFEASFMRIVAGRIGFVSDPANDISDLTYGLGVQAPIGSWASVGYDWASVPQAFGVGRFDRHGFSAWLHPGAIWESSRGAR